jgi:hypothetical protein
MTQSESGWLEFLRPSGERQKQVSALNSALATGCEAPGLYGKIPFLIEQNKVSDTAKGG